MGEGGNIEKIYSQLFEDSLILIAAASLISFLIRFMPGDPAATYLSSRGIPVTPESLHAVAEELKLYDPVYMQYIYWLKNVIRLDLGYSYLGRRHRLQLNFSSI